MDIEFLHALRQDELLLATGWMPPGASILELGGGTGFQAKRLAELGYRIESVDLEGSNYAACKVYPVRLYDGAALPFPDASFDLVYSSNTLEHVADPAALHRECARVLKPGGTCIHIVPSATWRFWSSLSHYLALAGRIPRFLNKGPRPTPQGRPGPARSGGLLALALSALLPPRHGERGTFVSELWHFSKRGWTRQFTEHGYRILACQPSGLFYTSELVLGRSWAIPSRRHWAPWLGSSCLLFRVQPTGRAGTSGRPSAG